MAFIFISGTYLMGVYKYRDVINIKADDEIIYISPDPRTLSRSDGCIPAIFSGLRFHKKNQIDSLGGQPPGHGPAQVAEADGSSFHE